MEEINESELNFNSQKRYLIVFSVCLSLLLLFFQNSFSNKTLLKKLANNSLNPVEALSNGKPTSIEFFAEWCEVCQEMAPDIISQKAKYDNAINFVMLNVDNPVWSEYIDKYNVSGIPKIVFLDKNGLFISSISGLRKQEELEIAYKNLITGDEISSTETSSISTLKINPEDTNNINPRSHG